jgi:hypothetical protein
MPLLDIITGRGANLAPTDPSGAPFEARKQQNPKQHEPNQGDYRNNPVPAHALLLWAIAKGSML